MTRIAVVGAGAVGGYLAATLARAGRDVTAIARGAHLQKIRAQGLTIRSAEGEFSVRIPASDDLGDFPAFDVVILTAKGPSLPALAETISPHLHDTTAVLFATNGVQWFYGDGFSLHGQECDTGRLDPDGILHDRIGAKRSLGVVIRSTNIVVEPGIVFNAGGGSYYLGEALPGSSQRCDDLVRLLDVTGAKFVATGDIRREMWKKLIRNAAVALLCGLTHTSPGRAYSDADTGPLASAIMAEAAAVALAHGFADLLDFTEEVATVSKMVAMKPSIVQDLEAGRRIELESQVLTVLDFARQMNVATPIMSVLAPILTLKARAAGCY